ncbi:uncharacterized protein N7477_007556 [Penicillium maclennaniae]|uniref:uncharacterized protein n=1 Tax=Penicillium maclennaniae TaxID=1343394 RepID=UPI0025410075|nr:uncharacterized protein N7477_007556 [Penicillium maclennaniae]KAJ5665108.1 hypothetical protein N7477_007556 [Penicillium maclennaniae]
MGNVILRNRPSDICLSGAVERGHGLEWPPHYEALGNDVETLSETGGTGRLPTGVECRVGTGVNSFTLASIYGVTALQCREIGSLDPLASGC